jgi:hypothetical protein
MLWTRIFSALSVVVFLYFSLPQIQGDSLYTFNNEDGRAGRIVSLDNDGVIYRARCQGRNIPMEWGTLEGVIFEEDCDRLSARQWRTYLGSSSLPKTLYFDVKLRNSYSIYAKAIALDSEFFYLTTLKTNISMKCSADQVRNLVFFVHRDEILTKSIPTLGGLTGIPKGFTRE